MDSRESWDPPIATLPRQQTLWRERAAPHASVGGSHLPAGEGRMGFARLTAKRQRRLGWLLWAGLVALVLAL